MSERKAIAPHSLVAMSEGAKKRTAFALAYAPEYEAWHHEAIDRKGCNRMRSVELRREGGLYGLCDRYAKVLTQFRKGERLRHCLGCSWCGTPPREDATRFTQCDGSGLLPSRRQRRRADAAIKAWTEWYRTNASSWDTVKDIEAELA